MTIITAPAPVPRAAVLATLDAVRRRESHGRVVGIRASRGLDDTTPMSDAHHEPITVRWCPSVLSLWDALTGWDEQGWLVLLTDRTEEEIGSGLLARMAQQRLHRPDAWDSVKQRFRATSLERALLDDARPHGAAIPEALLRLEPVTDPAGGWPAARSGVLSRDLVYGAVARQLLGLTIDPLDGPGLLEAGLDRELPTALADLRHRGGDPLADAANTWLAGLLGPAAPIARHALNAGDPARLLPLGIALAHITRAGGDQRHEASLAGARLEARLPDALRGASLPGATGPGADQLQAFTGTAEATVRSMLSRAGARDSARQVLRLAESILRDAQAPSLIAASTLLPGGLLARQRALAGSLGARADEVESLWSQILDHPLAALHDERGSLHHTLRAAVRLDRWLASQPLLKRSDGVGRIERAIGAARGHVLDGAWAESALGDLLHGADDPEIAAGLRSLADAVLERRRALDRAFARDLAPLAQGETLPGDRVRYLEEVLPAIGLHLARTSHAAQDSRRGGLLVLLLDGMSAAAAADLVTSIVGASDAWREILPHGQRRRSAALALLPSLTAHSRTSFFAGRPLTGGQAQEHDGLDALAREAGLSGAELFHKDDLSSSEAGSALTPKVVGAIEDVQNRPVVAAVLNTIDDALDKADPGGTRWTTSDIRFLRALLEQAHRAGRTVLLTADHGHVVERDGQLLRTPEATSARWRPATDAPGEGEVLVEGHRVLDGPAILAVDEDLRYTARRAGYHGGASLPEVAVPVVVLRPRPDEETEEAWTRELPDGWDFAADQRPLWWQARPAETRPQEPASPTAVPELTLDIPIAPRASVSAPEPAVAGLGSAIVESPRFADQVKHHRRRPDDATIADLVDQLVAAPGTRLPLGQVSQILGTSLARTGRSLQVIAQALNVEGFEVLRLENETVILQADLARTQFEVS